MRNDVWPLVHAERAAMIDDLARLDTAQWEQPSLCAGWTVHDVVAHLVHVARSTRLGFAADMLRAGFDFDRQNTRGIERARGATPQETLQRLREAATRTSTPIAPLNTRLVEEVVHGEDIRRPLGIRYSYSRKPSSGHFANKSKHQRLSAAPSSLSLACDWWQQTQTSPSATVSRWPDPRLRCC